MTGKNKIDRTIHLRRSKLNIFRILLLWRQGNIPRSIIIRKLEIRRNIEIRSSIWNDENCKKPNADEMGKCVHIKILYSAAGVTDLLNTACSFKLLIIRNNIAQ